MPRPLRIEYAGACYHVLNRGNYRSPLFGNKGAADAFERTLGEAAIRFGWEIHAYVVMRNHFHLAVRLGEPNLSVGMKWLQGTWVLRFNRFRRIAGRPFQGRYKALVVEPGHSFAQVCHYIHLNPVRAHIVEVDKLPEFTLSSLNKFRQKRVPVWLEPSTVLNAIGEKKPTRESWTRYLEFLAVLNGDKAASAELTSKRLSRGWCVGGDAFRKEMREEIEKSGTDLSIARFKGLEPTERESEKRTGWEERLVRLAEAARVDLNALPKKKSAAEKALLAAALKQSTSAANGWIAERLKMGAPASASQFARRWMLSPQGEKAVAKLLSRVKT